MIYIYMHKEDDIHIAQNIINELISDNTIYTTYTDSDRSQLALRQLKIALNKKAGIVMVYKISHLGQTTAGICRELTWLKDHQIQTIFIEYPSTWTCDPEKGQHGLAVILDVFQNQLNDRICQTTRSTPPSLGRKKIEFPDNWEELYDLWIKKEITGKQFIEQSGLKKGTFYHLVNEYKELLKLDQKNVNVG